MLAEVVVSASPSGSLSISRSSGCLWTHHEEFALPLHHQAGRYLIVAGVQYGVTAASTSLLPTALGVSTEIAYRVTVAVVL